MGVPHPLGIYKKSKRKILIKSGLREDNITKPIDEKKRSSDWQAAQQQTIDM